MGKGLVSGENLNIVHYERSMFSQAFGEGLAIEFKNIFKFYIDWEYSKLYICIPDKPTQIINIDSHL